MRHRIQNFFDVKSEQFYWCLFRRCNRPYEMNFSLHVPSTSPFFESATIHIFDGQNDCTYHVACQSVTIDTVLNLDGLGTVMLRLNRLLSLAEW